MQDLARILPEPAKINARSCQILLTPPHHSLPYLLLLLSGVAGLVCFRHSCYVVLFSGTCDIWATSDVRPSHTPPPPPAIPEDAGKR